ncbi:MAG: hypothetical protein M1834_004374 [Cirrosporium novae-zelandiae]|nr:MAG: hypothetical protein M1834_004374 [Cirrosporium novae-zelandiae]
MDSIPQWFRGVRLNFAENVLFSSESNALFRDPSPGYVVNGGEGGGSPPSKSESKFSPSQQSKNGKEDSKIAVVEVREGCSSMRDVTWGQLRKRVGRLSQALRARGVKKGDRVAAVASNSVDTLTIFLATASLGALFTSSSTDMGTKGILDRLLQVRPRWVFMDDWAVYNGKRVDLRGKMGVVVEGLVEGRVEEFEGMVAVPRFGMGEEEDVGGVRMCQTYRSFLEAAEGEELVFERVEFRDPFLIVYSSGTTGQPKCIVHSTGGVVLSAMKEGVLHRHMGPQATYMQYTTTGWIMYLGLVQSLLFGTKIIMYDGSPFKPDLTTYLRLLGDQKVTHLGTSPRYLHELHKNHIRPREITDLSNLRLVTSTGMVLSDALFEWFYDYGFPPHVQLGNISGGTDIAGALATDNPLLPVYVGGCQGPSLGTPVKVYDQLIEGGRGVKGKEVEHGTPGELVATAAFPNMPVMFWDDKDGSKYFETYFAKFDDTWTHGDFVMIHPLTKGMIFLGRADGVLNPSGVRFGSSEIYNIIDEKYEDSVADSICVGQRRPQDHDESVMLFLLMKPGVPFTRKLVNDIKTTIGEGLSKRHVPKYVFEAPEIPTTVNFKKVELPVKQIVSGMIVKPSGTLLNPQCLDYYYQFAKVEELIGPKSKI